MTVWSYLDLGKLSSERLCIQSWVKGWKSFYTFANNADVFYDIVDFFVLSNIAQSSANSGQAWTLGTRLGLSTHSHLLFVGSRFISRAAKTSLSLLRKQTETLATQVISDVPLLSEIFRWSNSTQKAVFHTFQPGYPEPFCKWSEVQPLTLLYDVYFV